jgi:hypothetical protein
MCIVKDKWETLVSSSKAFEQAVTELLRQCV